MLFHYNLNIEKFMRSFFNYPPVKVIEGNIIHFDFIKGAFILFFLALSFSTSMASEQEIFLAAENDNLPAIKNLIKNGADINKKKSDTGASALIIAASEGHKDIVNFLITKKADINTTTRCGYTLLLAAAAQGWVDIVKMLILNGVQINQNSIYGFTPLMMAVWGGHAETAELLLKHGADINFMPYKTMCALYTAIYSGNRKMVPILIRFGADVNPNIEDIPLIPVSKSVPGGGNEFGSTPQNNGPVDCLKYPNTRLLKGHQEIYKLVFPISTVAPSMSGYTPLMAAASKGLMDVVSLLISNGADIQAQTKRGVGVLSAACQSRNSKLVNYLINKGLDINNIDCFGNTPLSIASAAGDLESVKHLIEAGAEINPQNKTVSESVLVDNPYFNTLKKLKNPLKSAIAKSDWYFSEARSREAVVIYLLNNGAIITKAELGLKDSQEPFLVLALTKGMLNLSCHLIDKGADPNASYKNDPSLIYLLRKYMLNERYPILDAVELLCEKGADTNVHGKRGKTPLMLVAEAGNNGLLKILLSHGARVNEFGSSALPGNLPVTALGFAALRGRLSTVKLLVENGADMDIASKKGHTPLWSGVDRGHYSTTQFLLQKGSNPNFKSKVGDTPLFRAIANGDRAITELLIKYNADVNIELQLKSVYSDIKCSTPLRSCFEKKHLELAKLLLNHGADIRSKCMDGLLTKLILRHELDYATFLIENGVELYAEPSEHLYTPLMASVYADEPSITELLLKRGANIDATGRNGYTALMMACQTGNERLFELLLDLGANPRITAQDGYTAYIIATNLRHSSIAGKLIIHGGITAGAIKYNKALKILNIEIDGTPPSPAELDNYLTLISKKYGIKDIFSFSPDQMFSTPEKTWKIYRKALDNFDLELALKCHSLKTRNKYREIFSSLGSQKTKAIAAGMNSLEKIEADGRMAKYRLVRNENGKEITYKIFFTNYFGEWKIENY